MTDRNYWDKRSTNAMMKMVDRIFADLGELTAGYELKYNKFYVGISKDGAAKNFIYFRPKKSFVYLYVMVAENEARSRELEDAGLDAPYVSRNRRYQIRLDNFDQYEKNKELLLAMVSEAKKKYEGSDDE